MSTKFVTMQDVAEHARVSKTTVSHVLNATRPVSDDLRQRVVTAVSELGYHPNSLARSLRRKESSLIGLIIPSNANPFYAEVARGVEELAFEAGFGVILCNSERSLEREIQYTELLNKQRVEGILFVGVFAGDRSAHLHLLSDQQMPFILVDRFVADLQVDTIVTDNAHGGRMATSYLLSLGHRRIGCLGGLPTHTPNAERIAGYRSALEEAGLAIDADLVLRTQFTFEGGYTGVRKLLASERRPTAIFACNDLMAIGAIRGAIEMGLRVPEDLSVVGFDDIQMAAYINPTLTTIAQPKAEMGRRATEMLLERIRKSSLPPRSEVLQPALIVRGSTSRPAH